MLISLRIENFAIVSHLELHFNSGMTVFTGETGAGKSIMIDALTYALGARADASIVRAGCKACDILACFEIADNSSSAEWLSEYAIPCEENQVYLRRVISPEGRSRAYINGIPMPLQKIKEFSEHIVGIHGQHEYQTLLAPTTHREQLDRFAHHSELLQSVRDAYQHYERLQDKLNTLKQAAAHEDKKALLQYQVAELEELNCFAGEVEALEQEHHLLHNAKAYLESIAAIKNTIQENEGHAVLASLYQVQQTLHGLARDNASIQNAEQLIQNAMVYCEEALTEINGFERHIQLDPERLSVVESRMALLHQMARKYHITPEALWQLVDARRNELEVLQANHVSYALLLEELELAKVTFDTLAAELSASRIKNKGDLERAITEKIQQLGMPHGILEVKVTPLDKRTLTGQDKVEYMVATNPGNGTDSLMKVASGGELSRISLAIQLVTAQQGVTPTLLFDEVDVGIGGATAALVGRMLKQLGQSLQVFCVTHQPQVAACGDHHFQVEKNVIDAQTYSSMKILDADSRVDELARMLGGLTVTEETILHAKGLLATP